MTLIRWGRVFTVTVKELRDTLRDRRTLLMMVLVPALLYPLGGLFVAQLTSNTLARMEREGYEVAVQGPRHESITAALARDATLRVREAADAEEALRRQPGGAALGLRIALAGAGDAAQVRVELIHDSASPRSGVALDRARAALSAEAKVLREQRLSRLRLSEEALTPLRMEERSISSGGRTVLARLAPGLGILLILISLMGAFYPAIDLLAGERERGTLEPLLSTPTSRLEIVAGKYLCLAVLALSTCALNLLSLAGTTSFLVQKVAQAGTLLRPSLIALLFVGACPVLLMVTAFLLLAAAFARSFKDAQNLMTPVYLLCLLPAMAGLVPEAHLTTGNALVPVLGAVLFIKDACLGTLQPGPGFLAVVAGLFYAALGIALAAFVFDRAALIGMRAADGLSVLAAPAGQKGEQAATLTGALSVYGVCLALMLHAGPRLQFGHLRTGLILTELLLLLLPVVAFLGLTRVPWRDALAVHPIVPRQVPGAILCGLGGLGLALCLWSFVVQQAMKPPEEVLRALQDLLPKNTRDLLLLILIAAALPAICEEALCRGLLLQAGRRVLGDGPAIVLSGFLFAALHLDPYRFPGTLLLGCLLGVVAVRSRSIIPSMIMHFTNNATALVVGTRMEGQHLPARTGILLLLGAAAALGAGLYLVRRREARPAQVDPA